MNMGSMNQPDNVVPIVSIEEIGKEVTQEQIKFISTGKASPDFVVKFIKNRMTAEDKTKKEVEEYLMSLSMELLISLVKFVEEKRNEPKDPKDPKKSEVSMESITKFIEEQLIEKAA
jgi:hypothetical protein